MSERQTRFPAITAYRKLAKGELTLEEWRDLSIVVETQEPRAPVVERADSEPPLGWVLLVIGAGLVLTAIGYWWVTNG